MHTAPITVLAIAFTYLTPMAWALYVYDFTPDWHLSCI